MVAAGASPKPAASGDQPQTSTKNDGISTSQPNAEPTNRRLGDVADGEAAQPEQVEVEQRVGMVGRAQRNAGSSTAATSEAGDGPGVVRAPSSETSTITSTRAPTAMAAIGTATGSKRSLAALAVGPDRRTPAADDGGDDEREVDEEHRPPTASLDEDGAERRGDRPAEPGDAAPHPDRHRAPGRRELRAAGGPSEAG